jgi:hypothetical protein
MKGSSEATFTCWKLIIYIIKINKNKKNTSCSLLSSTSCCSSFFLAPSCWYFSGECIRLLQYLRKILHSFPLSYPCNRQWRPVRLWDVEDPTFCLNNRLTDCGKICQPYAPAALYLPGRFLVLISVRGWVDRRAIVRLEGLGKLKKIHVIGTRSRDLPACSVEPQPTTLPRAPQFSTKVTFIPNNSSGNRSCYIYEDILFLGKDVPGSRIEWSTKRRISWLEYEPD